MEIRVKDAYSLKWVDEACSKYPHKGDELFRSAGWDEGESCDWEMNARLGGGTDEAYLEGYQVGGRLLADHVFQNRQGAGFLIYPMLFLYRHNVELQLKQSIRDAAFLADYGLSEDERKVLESHDLNNLWSLFWPILQSASQGAFFDTVGEDLLEGIGSCVHQLHKVDPGSFSFRYKSAKSGKPSIDKGKYPCANVRVLAQRLECVTAHLSELRHRLHDACDVKCRMDAENAGYSMDNYGDW